MQAITIQPGVASSVELSDLPRPPRDGEQLLVEALVVGVCGTDRELVNGHYGTAPPGEQRLILGHESLGRVSAAPPNSGFATGDLVVGIVRRPDPVPCPNCAVGEWDMCRNGLYTECGIKGRHGFGAEQYLLEPEFAVKLEPSLGLLGVLLEPASILAKAWEHIERIGARSRWQPRRVLVTGAGPVGLLAALMARQRGFEVHVLDRVEDGPKPDLVRDLGATYHSSGVANAGPAPDIAIECTGVGQLVFDVMLRSAPGAIVCLTGISSGGREIPVDAALLNRALVLENDVVFGSVNANRRHYQQGAAALARADGQWLSRLITRRVPLHRWNEALERRDGDVKTVIVFDPVTD
jgi:threonine dehydrogenase-like Zn-dependent dehydrogenase